MGKQPKRKVNEAKKTMPEGQILTDASNSSWRLSKCIGQGGFGLIYLAYLTTDKTSYSSYVIKMESSDSGPLFCEKQVYIRALGEKNLREWRIKKNLDFLALPRYIGFGTHDFEESRYRFLVMDRFGQDLQSKINSSKNGRLSPSDVYRISIDVINALEYLHDHEYVHGDVKASNLLLSTEKSTKDRYVLADFGLSFRYSVDGVHKKFAARPKKAHNGTIEFTSQDAHVGADPSRRGDLEILGFCMVQWMCGRLPWEDCLKTPSAVAKMKQSNMRDLNHFMSTCFPPSDASGGLIEYFESVEELEYTERPKYDKLRSFLSDKGSKKIVKPIRGSSKRKERMDSTVETESMGTEEYFEKHPSADIKSGRRVYKPVSASCKRHVRVQVDMHKDN